MNVVIMTTDFPPLVGGIGTFSANVARALQMTGVDVSVVTSVPALGDEPVDDLAVTRGAALLNRKGIKMAGLAWRTALACRRPGQTTLLAMAWTHEGLVALLIRRLFGVRYALVAHGSEILRHRSGPLRAIMGAAFRSADVVICNSAFTRDLVLSEGLGHNVHVVNPPVETPEAPTPALRARLEEDLGLRGMRIVLTAARLVKRKGHARMLRVLAELRNRHPDVIYVMTGDGPMRVELERIARDCHVDDRVRMLGYVAREELAALLHMADIYVSPAEDDKDDIEGFGIALVEAALCGKPVIAGGCGGVPDAVVDGETGLLIDPRDDEALRESLTRLLDDTNLSQHLGERARKRAVERFSVVAQGPRLADLLSGASVGAHAAR
jgi:phosphatidylinositol alpha-1,6-mannosyltransferase